MDEATRILKNNDRILLQARTLARKVESHCNYAVGEELKILEQLYKHYKRDKHKDVREIAALAAVAYDSASMPGYLRAVITQGEHDTSAYDQLQGDEPRMNHVRTKVDKLIAGFLNLILNAEQSFMDKVLDAGAVTEAAEKSRADMVAGTHAFKQVLDQLHDFCKEQIDAAGGIDDADAQKFRNQLRSIASWQKHIGDLEALLDPAQGRGAAAGRG